MRSQNDETECLDSLQISLQQADKEAVYWNYSWFGILGASAGLNLYRLSETVRIGDQSGENYRAYYTINSVQPVLGIGEMFFRPVTADRSYLNAKNDTTCQRINRYEQSILNNIGHQKIPILKHVGVWTTAIISGLILGQGYGSWHLARISALVTGLGGEFKIWTRPSSSSKFLKNLPHASSDQTTILGSFHASVTKRGPVIEAELRF